jgi:LysR family nitrogen assimilation transcriptional regulator
MTLTQLRYFVAVARSKSLSRAADELHIAQPAITRQLKLLETELEAVLFTRHHRGVELTDAGRQLLDRAEFQIHSFDRIRGEFRALSFAPTGRIRIGCPPALTRPLLRSRWQNSSGCIPISASRCAKASASSSCARY